MTRTSSPWRLAGVSLAALVGTVLTGSAARIAPVGTVSIYSVPTPYTEPRAIALGPNGNMWFTELVGDKVAKITPQGRITEYPVPDPNGAPMGITAGPDGNVWFTEGGRQGRQDHPARRHHATTRCPPPRASPGTSPPGPTATCGSPRRSARQVGQDHPTAVPSPSTRSPTPTAYPEGITAGPDGNLWFTESTTNVAEITTRGVVTEYPVPADNGDPVDIAAGPDGNLWYTLADVPAVARITTRGRTTEFRLPSIGSDLDGIAAGADGNLWFTAGSQALICRITTHGVMTEYPVHMPATDARRHHGRARRVPVVHRPQQRQRRVDQLGSRTPRPATAAAWRTLRPRHCASVDGC